MYGAFKHKFYERAEEEIAAFEFIGIKKLKRPLYKVYNKSKNIRLRVHAENNETRFWVSVLNGEIEYAMVVLHEIPKMVKHATEFKLIHYCVIRSSGSGRGVYSTRREKISSAKRVSNRIKR